jgi:hypothetical protein
MNRVEIHERLAASDQRLTALAAAEFHGLSTPDPGADERWDAGQIWAHLAEFPTYWLGQVLRIIDAAAAGQPQPIPFGRTKTDPGRVGAVERDRRQERSLMLERMRRGIEMTRKQLSGFTLDELDVHGLHPVRGEMTVAAIIERFIVDHLEEHAEQLEQLTAASPSAVRRG